MTFNSASNRWEYTVTVPANATELDCVFNNGSGTWDNNSGAELGFLGQQHAAAAAPAAEPHRQSGPDQPDQPQLVRRLGRCRLHRQPRRLTRHHDHRHELRRHGPDREHALLLLHRRLEQRRVSQRPAPPSAPTRWPPPTTNYPPFVLDGTFDYPGYLLASSGMVLYGALRGTTLYVATWSPGTNGPNDHFIFVTDQLLPAATAAAPWAKTGKVAVASSKPFLAGESLNTYVAWANAPASAQACQSRHQLRRHGRHH